MAGCLHELATNALTLYVKGRVLPSPLCSSSVPDPEGSGVPAPTSVQDVERHRSYLGLAISRTRGPPLVFGAPWKGTLHFGDEVQPCVHKLGWFLRHSWWVD